MANANRKAIEFMVQGALPPHDTNVLWMDTSNPTAPVIKTFNAGAWVSVHTEQSKIDKMLCETIIALTAECKTLTDDVLQQLSLTAKEATLLRVTTPASNDDIYAMFPGSINDEGFFVLDFAIDEDGYIIADFSVNNEGIVIFN